MKNYVKLFESAKNAELSLKNAESNILTVWCEIHAENLELKAKKEIDLITFKNGVIDATGISSATYDKRISMINSAIKKGINPLLFASFNAMETAKGNITKGTHKATKKGTIIADHKNAAKIEDEKRIIQATNENDLVAIMADAEFLQVAKMVSSKGWTKALLMKALATYEKNNAEK